MLAAVLAAALAPAGRYWASARQEYPQGIGGIIHCFRDCLWLGYGGYHPPTNLITMAEGDLLRVYVKPTRLDLRTSAGMGECASVAENSRGTVLATWMMRDERDGQANKVYARKLRFDGTPVTPDYRVNTGASSRMLAHHVCLRVDADGYFYVLWNAARTPNELVHGGSGIFMRVYNPDGVPAAPEAQVSSNLSGAMPELAVSKMGAAVAVWSDNGHVWGRLLSHDGPRGRPSRLDDAPVGAVAEYPAIAFGVDGNLLAAWADTRTGGRDVYARLLDPQLRPIFASIRAGDGPVPNEFFRLISVAGTSAGYALIWMRPGTQRGRWFSHNGRALGSQIDVLPGTSEVATLPRPDGSVFASNGQSIRIWYPDRLGKVIPLLPSPSRPNEISLAASREGMWLAWHDSLDRRLIPGLGDNFFIMAARVALNNASMQDGTASTEASKGYKN